ncbi:hypothetical protein AC230_01540 [Streptomyces caatingaensis]|uniref:Uncharacterized protein n=1 Tax=Streptomyces caatingaensis TaxID=1678637 RepID=A0A0K9XJ24_9ACTN|nr:hypothetical protein AC230_01540 [Streptomyces caatingaensis]
MTDERITEQLPGPAVPPPSCCDHGVMDSEADRAPVVTPQRRPRAVGQGHEGHTCSLRRCLPMMAISLSTTAVRRAAAALAWALLILRHFTHGTTTVSVIAFDPPRVPPPAGGHQPCGPDLPIGALDDRVGGITSDV